MDFHVPKPKFSYPEEKLDLENKEIEILKEAYTSLRHVFILEFDRDIQELTKVMESNPYNEFLHLAFKGILVMKKNWAKSIDELDKLSSSILLNNEWGSIEELKNEWEIKQEKDLNEALLLSEKIKNLVNF